MVNLTIDNINVSVPEGTTIMDAAKMADIPIPKLCYLKDINEIAACRVCVVELEGMERLVTSCNNVVKEGMVIHTNSPKVRTARRQTVQLILSQHDCKCATCVRSGNCTLQSLANDLNIIEVPFKQRLEEFPWDKEFPLIRDSQKCIKCMRCIQVCDKIQDLHIWDVTSTGSRTTINVTGNIRSPKFPVLCAVSVLPTARSALCANVMIQRKYGMQSLMTRKLLLHRLLLLYVLHGVKLLVFPVKKQLSARSWML